MKKEGEVLNLLTDMHIAVIGGDARQLEVIRKLSEQDAKVSLIGFDQLDDGFVGSYKEHFDTIDPSTVDAVILPVSGMSDDREIESIFSREKTILPEGWLEKTQKHAVIYTGISNEKMKEMVKNANRKLIELVERDDVAIYNSIPTAEGTIMLVIQNTDITIHDSNIIVTGFGRVGKTVARAFQSLGANVKVAADEPELRARAFEFHLESFPVKELKDHVRDVDVIINTIPAQVVNANVLSKMLPHGLVVDLASKPGGTDFRYAEKRGIKALLALGLPGIVAPKTAGQIIAGVLATLLQEDWKEVKGGRN